MVIEMPVASRDKSEPRILSKNLRGWVRGSWKPYPPTDIVTDGQLTYTAIRTYVSIKPDASVINPDWSARVQYGRLQCFHVSDLTHA